MTFINAGEICISEDQKNLILKRKGFPCGIIVLDELYKKRDPEKFDPIFIYSEDLLAKIGICFYKSHDDHFYFFDTDIKFFCQWRLLKELISQNRPSLHLLINPDNNEDFPKKNPTYSVIKQEIIELLNEEDYLEIISGLWKIAPRLISKISSQIIDYGEFNNNLAYYFVYYPFYIETLYRIMKKYEEHFKNLIHDGRVDIAIFGSGSAPEMIGTLLFFNLLKEKSTQFFSLFDIYEWKYRWQHDIPKKMSEHLDCESPNYKNYKCNFFDIEPNKFNFQEIIANSDCIIVPNIIQDLLNLGKSHSDITDIFINIIEMMKEGCILIITDITGSWKTVTLLNQLFKVIEERKDLIIITENIEFGIYKPNFNMENEDYQQIKKYIDVWYKIAQSKDKYHMRTNTEFSYIIIEKR